MKKLLFLCVAIALLAYITWVYFRPANASLVTNKSDVTAVPTTINLSNLIESAERGDTDAQFMYGKALTQPGTTNTDYKAAAT
jgi:hypothetical protein